MPPERHWLHPQTVPRGFLRIYILTLLSKGAHSGYSIIQAIDERTEGAWKPGPGTMYPLLKGLEREGLVASKGRGRSRRSYVLTPKGGRELAEIRGQVGGLGRKDAVMARLFSDLLPVEVFMSMIIRRIRENTEFIMQKTDEIPPEKRAQILRELRSVIESQLSLIDRELAAQPKAGDSAKPNARKRS